MVNQAPDSTALTRVRGVRLEVCRLTHCFALKRAPLAVLEDVSVFAAPGTFVALLGPSGCGKSTLLRILAGLEQPTLGEVSVDGRRIDGPNPDRALVFQDPTLYPWRTVWRNVALGLEARGQRVSKDDPRVRHVLEWIGLSAFAHAYPSQLSGGMAQRVALARVLVNEPSLLLLDEPLGRTRRPDPAHLAAGVAAPVGGWRLHGPAGHPRRGRGALPGRPRIGTQPTAGASGRRGSGRGAATPPSRGSALPGTAGAGAHPARLRLDMRRCCCILRRLCVSWVLSHKLVGRVR